jgi:hypothetical protein
MAEAKREHDPEQMDRIERMLLELLTRGRPKARVRRKIERARANLVALHAPTELDRAAARKALSRYR